MRHLHRPKLRQPNPKSVRRAASKQVTVAALGHPLGPSKVGLPSPSGASRVAVRIDVQHDSGDLTPVGPIGFSVEQAKIGDQVLLVVAGQNGRRGRQISA